MKKNIIILTVVSILGLSSLEAMKQPNIPQKPLSTIEDTGEKPTKTPTTTVYDHLMGKFDVGTTKTPNPKPVYHHPKRVYDHLMSKFNVRTTKNKKRTNKLSPEEPTQRKRIDLMTPNEIQQAEQQQTQPQQQQQQQTIIYENYSSYPDVRAEIDFQRQQTVSNSIGKIYKHFVDTQKQLVDNAFLVNNAFNELPTLLESLNSYFEKANWNEEIRELYLKRIAQATIESSLNPNQQQTPQLNPVVLVNGNITINNINNPIIINNVDPVHQPSTQVQQQDQRIKRLDKISITNLLNPQ